MKLNQNLKSVLASEVKNLHSSVALVKCRFLDLDF